MISSKSLSSPSRTEKYYPPPLMRFMRGHVSSKSRGRSRASPMFVRKKNSTIETTQEPSSPKVTCIGQVRSRRSKKQTGIKPGPSQNGRCHCVGNALFCGTFNGKLKNQSSDTNSRRWVSFFRYGFRKRSEIGGKACEFESICPEKVEEIYPDYEQNEEEEDEEKLMCSSSIKPPKNALMLTRCRSTPYRSSSLASRFWEEEEFDPQKTEPDNIVHQQSHHVQKNDGPTLESEPKCRDSASESRSDQESEKLCSKENEIESAKRVEIEKTGEVCSVHRPLMLTRSKSEPASRTSEKIHPDEEDTCVCEIVID